MIWGKIIGDCGVKEAAIVGIDFKESINYRGGMMATTTGIELQKE